MIDFVYRAVLIGIGATALLDLWVLGLHYVLKTPGANWRPVGRWFCHIAKGMVLHEDIANAKPFRHELAIGWIGHYVIRNPVRRNTSQYSSEGMVGSADTRAGNAGGHRHNWRRLVYSAAGNGRWDCSVETTQR